MHLRTRAKTMVGEENSFSLQDDFSGPTEGRSSRFFRRSDFLPDAFLPRISLFDVIGPLLGGFLQTPAPEKCSHRSGTCSSTPTPREHPRPAPAHQHHWNAFSGKTAVLLTAATMMVQCYGAGAVCVDVAVDKGEAVIKCPLTADVIRTKHVVLVKHFSPDKKYPDESMACDWVAEDRQECSSRYGFTEIEVKKDYIMAKIKETNLQKEGVYKCQLIPPDERQAFTDCEIYHAEEPEGPNTATVPVVTTTAGHLNASAPPAIDIPTCADGSVNGGLVAAVVTLTVTVIILLLIDACLILLFCSRYRKGYRIVKRRGGSHMNGVHHPLNQIPEASI
ncbi:uncharacterized protein LOC143291587 isoform X2 [Babylonia areolata]|uniref:uncharacterized protein LOC143291587 isoform X2 n=1 Tax=Babylonia areolata TaxID=304850 RepID=UPI003FD25B6E